MKKITDGSGDLISNANSWCRKKDCRNHPVNKSFLEGVKVCFMCKHFVPKDMYMPQNLREM